MYFRRQCIAISHKLIIIKNIHKCSTYSLNPRSQLVFLQVIVRSITEEFQFLLSVLCYIYLERVKLRDIACMASISRSDKVTIFFLGFSTFKSYTICCLVSQLEFVLSEHVLL